MSEGPKGGRRKGGRGRKLSHFSFCCAFRCCVVYSPCFPVWGEEKVMTIYDAGPLAAGPLCGLLTNFAKTALLRNRPFIFLRTIAQCHATLSHSHEQGYQFPCSPTDLSIVGGETDGNLPCHILTGGMSLHTPHIARLLRSCKGRLPLWSCAKIAWVLFGTLS